LIEFKITLENNYVRLVQTSEDHFQELYQIGSNPVIWEQHPNQDRWKKNNFRKYFDGGINNSEGCFTIIDKKINKIIGTTRFYSFDENKQSVKIGYTFISNEYWGTKINYQIKKLMMDYIFQFLDKVYFEIGKTNFRSQKSVEKLGGKKVKPQKKENYLYLIDKSKWKG
jgi:RimJ/RimL family protein N-acetyltransferase